jgi:hypothetical protein
LGDAVDDGGGHAHIGKCLVAEIIIVKGQHNKADRSGEGAELSVSVIIGWLHNACLCGE